MKKIVIKINDVGKRIDKFLASSFAKASADKEEFFSYSRGEIAKKIKNGEAQIDGKKIKTSYSLKEGDIICVENFSKKGSEKKLIGNSEIFLDVLFENADMIVINKQPGIQVHPSPNEKKHTIANALVARFPEMAKVHDSSIGAEFRPGIVHRLDKDTSGVMVVARSKKAFDELKKLFADREVEKKYVAICEGIFSDKEGIIEKPLARSSSYRKQVIARENTKTIIRKAATAYKVIREYENYSLIEAFPKTGRMHQIRIHLSSIGHPVVGDTVYAGKKKKEEQKKAPRQLLHAKELKFGLFGKKYSFVAPIPRDFRDFILRKP